MIEPRNDETAAPRRIRPHSGDIDASHPMLRKHSKPGPGLIPVYGGRHLGQYEFRDHIPPVAYVEEDEFFEHLARVEWSQGNYNDVHTAIRRAFSISLAYLGRDASDGCSIIRRSWRRRGSCGRSCDGYARIMKAGA